MTSSRGSAAGRPTSPAERKRVELGLWKGKGEQWRLRQDEFPATIRGARSAGWVVDELAVSSQKRDADKKRKGEKRQRKAHPCQ